MSFTKFNNLKYILENSMKRYLTVKEAAEIVRVAPQTIRNLISQKRLKSGKFAGRRLISQSALEELIKVDTEQDGAEK